MEITPEKLAFYNIDMEYVVEPGEFTVTVGSSSVDTKNSATLTVRKG